jgi:hypothetical protein
LKKERVHTAVIMTKKQSLYPKRQEAPGVDFLLQVAEEAPSVVAEEVLEALVVVHLAEVVQAVDGKNS